MIELPVSYFANSVEIIAEIWNKNLSKYSECAMVFDTGASMTTIDTAIIRRAGYNLKNAEKINVSGVGNANITGHRITLFDFKLGGKELGPVLVDVISFPEDGNTFAVLGMNIIKEFKTEADWQDKRCNVKGSIERDATIWLNPTFDIADKPAFETFNPANSRFGIWALNSGMTKPVK
ncbi:MAG: retroviral-like aspartic protease family protein [Oscillospiraceae bacterium]|nr:retroviral-like aspartic protease family protein [Oscillospiraceae bacterium]